MSSFFFFCKMGFLGLVFRTFIDIVLVFREYDCGFDRVRDVYV